MKWIDIKKRKPEHGQKCLISDGEIVTAAEADLATFKHIWWDMCEIIGYDCEWDFNETAITHWAPLPEPPKRSKTSK